MKELNRFLLLGLVLVLIAGCSKMEVEPDPLYSGDNTALKGAKVQMVPFKSAFDTWGLLEELIYHSDGYPIGVHVVVFGSGKANHLGKTTMNVDQDWYFGEEGEPMHGFSVITLTAANGDQLIIDFEGDMNAADYSNINIWGTGDINGGTGRFTDADGKVELVATFNKTIGEGGEGETFMTGKIKY